MGQRGLVEERPIGRRMPMELEERALNRGWPISEETRLAIIQDAIALATNPEKTDKVRLQAMRVLIMADSLNVRRERNEQDGTQGEKRIQVERFRALLESGQSQQILTELNKLTLSENPTPPTPPALLEPKEGEGGG